MKRKLEDDRKQIENQAADLDRRLPGWFYRIDTDALDMEDPEHCVLGQIFGDYGSGLKLLGMTINFSPCVYGTNSKYNKRWKQLWSIEVLKRAVV